MFVGCAVVAVVRSSGMVVECEPLMSRMSCAILKLERFASRSCSACLTPLLSQGSRSELNKSVLSGPFLLGSPFKVELLAFYVGVLLLVVAGRCVAPRCLVPATPSIRCSAQLCRMPS